MRILYICLNPAQKSLKNALGNYGEVYQLNWKEYTKQRLNLKIRELAPKVTHAFMQLHRGDIVTVDTLKHLKKHNVKTLNWTGDVRHNTPNWMLSQAPYFSYTGFSNMRDVDHFIKFGLKALYIPMGYEFFDVKECDRDIKLSFLGSHYNSEFPLSAKRHKLVTDLQKLLGKDFVLHGRGWGTTMLPYEKIGQIYRRSQYALNLPHFDIEGYNGNRLVNICNQGAIPVHGLNYETAEELIADLPNLKHQPEMAFSWIDTLKVFFKP
jgi:hypothetical protein